MHYKDTDYLHAAARIAYLENQLLSKEELLKLINSEGAENAYQILSNKMIFKGYSMEQYELAFEKNLAETYDLIEDITGNMGITDIFRYHIDGHNLKVMIKSKLADGNFDNLYKIGGTIELEILKREFESNAFYYIPSILSEKTLEAVEKLARTRDSQIVDVLLDKAVFALMRRKAEELRCEYLTKYVMTKINLVNVKSSLRLLRVKKDTFTASKFFVEGGSFSITELEEAYSMGYDGMAALISKTTEGTRIAEAINMVKMGRKISVFDRQADECIKVLFEETRTVPFGIEPVITYIYLKEKEIKACRFVLLSKVFGLSKDNIIERVRDIYAD